MYKKDTIKEFTNDDELKSFCEQTWGDYIRSLNKLTIINLLSVQSHGLKQGDIYDNKIIKVYEKEIWKFPPVPFDIIVYRGGKMKIDGRPFLSASFYESKAKEFAGKDGLHKIIIREGTHVVPSLWLSQTGAFGEKEVIFDVSLLHKRIGYYEYF
ncbi:MAG: hypothetical protein K2J26_02725 [Ruminococcus sp.]|nr:hypothetical protein [Ruminococcus sp.]